MTHGIPVRDPPSRRSAWITSSIDLQTPDLHDFSDFDWGGVRPNRLLRWTIVIVLVMTVAHFVPGAREDRAAAVVAVAVVPPH